MALISLARKLYYAYFWQRWDAKRKTPLRLINKLTTLVSLFIIFSILKHDFLSPLFLLPREMFWFFWSMCNTWCELFFLCFVHNKYCSYQINSLSVLDLPKLASFLNAYRITNNTFIVKGQVYSIVLLLIQCLLYKDFKNILQFVVNLQRLPLTQCLVFLDCFTFL